MGLKKWMQRLRPATLYVVLMLSVVHFMAQMVICQLTDALTLLLDSCHMLCNIISLVGCLMTLKYESKVSDKPQPGDVKNESNSTLNGSGSVISSSKDCDKEKHSASGNDAKQLRNTFGWARIESLRMLIVCIFFVSLSFSVLVESVQTLIHIDHMGDIRYPTIILIIGFVGLILNIICYLLIGGFTYHQGGFLHLNTSGEIVLDGVTTTDAVLQGQRRLSRFKSVQAPKTEQQRESFGDITKDITSCSIVIIFAIIAIFVDVQTVKYCDVVFAIISALVLLFLNFPYIKESGLILLQTIPNSMNIETLHADLLKTFPDIQNIHDFHVWQHTPGKIILTMHIIFSNPLDYVHQCDQVVKFLLEQGVTEVTIQPEFQSSDVVKTCGRSACLMPCKSEHCNSKHCCNMINDNKLSAIKISNGNESEESNEDKTRS